MPGGRDQAVRHRVAPSASRTARAARAADSPLRRVHRPTEPASRFIRVHRPQHAGIPLLRRTGMATAPSRRHRDSPRWIQRDRARPWRAFLPGWPGAALLGRWERSGVPDRLGEAPIGLGFPGLADLGFGAPDAAPGRLDGLPAERPAAGFSERAALRATARSASGDSLRSPPSRL